MANVYTSLSNALWYTDKCSISTGATPVTYQVYATALGTAAAVGNIYSGPPEIGSYEVKQIYVGVGNYITVTGTGYTAQELGTQSSAQAGVGNFTELLTPSTTQNGSALFSGTNHLDVATQTAFGFGTGDLTLEGWYYHTAGGAFHVLFDFRTTATQVAMLVAVNTSDKIYLYVNGSVVITTTASLTLNSWVHVAISRVSGSTRLFVNGTQSGITYADTNNYVSPAPLALGADYVGANRYVGYASNMRIVKGVGVYAGNFSPLPLSNLEATQLANVNGSPSAAITGTQTSLLLNTFQGAGFLTDSSTNNLTVVNTGGVSSAALNPF
jgi:hypothetical protein